MENFFLGIPAPILTTIAVLISIFQLFVKAVALFRAARMSQRNWFIALFILIPFNDLGILELVYLFRFAKKKLTFREIGSWIKR